MVEKEQEEGFEKLLVSQLARTLDFVRFSEAKNGALLAFSSAWIVASVNLLTGQAKLPPGYTPALSVALLFFAVGGIISIASFLPRSLRKFHRPEDGSKNLLFFGDASTIEVTALREQFSGRYMPLDGHAVAAGYLDDLCVQISVNSKIAARKFKMFNAAALSVLASIGVLGLPPLWWGLETLLRIVSR